MINKVGQIMLYVNDQDEAVRFWTEKLDFTVIAEENNNQGFRWIEIAPKTGAETTLILHNKEFVSKMSPGLNLDTPSLMYFTDSIEQLHSELKGKEITVGEIVNMPTGRVFNFADFEENYFAVLEK
ncbi:VOC family protein [Mesobacillus jeotgali]|uniref:VOC family protein n=1 Tax=Mesobacillus jeotgali TaxID=129985 RepID=UPI0009A65C64|nr:VOC family protein [Mesobacillus jeotgali]